MEFWVYFAELYQQLWLYIFPVAYYALVTVAVWNCATLYTKDKLENKQPYGWAIGRIRDDKLDESGKVLLLTDQGMLWSLSRQK